MTNLARTCPPVDLLKEARVKPYRDLFTFGLCLILVAFMFESGRTQSFQIVDEFETHNWHWFGWGDDAGSLEYSTAWKSEGSSSLKLTSTKNTTGWNIFGTGAFNQETPDSIKMDLRAVDGHRLEVKAVDSNNQEHLLGAINMSASTTYLDWKVELNGNNMRKMYLVQAWYSGTVTVYVDNIRTYDNGVETVWDRMETPQYYWDGSADADNKDFEVQVSDDITHSFSSPNFSSTAAMTMNWDKDIFADDDIAQIQATFSQAKDWSNFYYFRADVYRPSTTPDCSLFVFIWDGTQGAGTDWLSIPANTWTTLTWKMGLSIDMSNIEEIKLVVPNTNIHTDGILYIDNLQVGGFTPKQSAVNLASLGVPFGLDDFDGRVPDPVQPDSVVREGQNGYFGFSGAATSFNGELDVGLSSTDNNGFANSKPFSWKLTYDIDFDIDTWFAYWSLLGPGSDPPPRDMTVMEKFSIAMKSDDLDPASSRIIIEFHDASWGEIDPQTQQPNYDTGKAFAVLSGVGTDWQQWVIPFDPDSLTVWEPFDPTELTEVVVSLDSSTASRTSGTFYIDDLTFIDTDEVYWDDADFDVDFLDLVARRTFNYFVEAVDDTTRLVLDRVTFRDLATVAGTGFGLGAIVIGVDRGWMNADSAEVYVEKVLTNLWQTPQGSATTGVSGYKGFFYHFLEAGTGLRKIAPPHKDPVELSVVDTAILMAGVLTAREYFAHNSTIVDLADKLYRRIEWPWFYDPSVNQFYLGWSPEGGFVGHWDVSTDEVMLINLLAVGSPTHPVPANCFYAWTRDTGTYNDRTIINSWNGSLFQYFFTHCWFDLHDKTDAQRVNWWENSIEAGYANRDYCIAGYDGSGRSNVPTFSAESWGLTACEAIPAGLDTFYLGGNGALPTFQSDFDPNFNGVYFGENDGTVPPYGAASMIGFSAYPGGFNETYVYDALKNYYKNTQLWTGLYGFRDAYTDSAAVKEGAESKFPIYKNNFFSIDEGPMLIMIENYRSKLIWETLGQNDYMQYAVSQIFTPDLRVNDDLTGATQINPATAGNRHGQYVSVWSDRRNSDTDAIYAQRFHTVDDVGTFRVDGINMLVTSGDTASVTPAVAVNANGEFLVTWHNHNEVFARLFDVDSSSALTGAISINSTPIYNNDQWQAAVAASDHGQFAVVWTGEDGGKDVYVQRVDTTGALAGGNVKVNTDGTVTDQFQADVAMADDGSFVVVWTDGRAGSGQTDIYGQRFDQSGGVLGGNFKVNGSTTRNFKPSVSASDDGQFVVAWIDTSNSTRTVRAARFDASGSQQGSELSVSSHSSGPAIVKPDVAVDSTGAFIVVWQDSREGSMDIYMQRYTASGAANGQNTRVNGDVSEANQIKPAITYLRSTGDYQIIWQDDRNGDWDIYCPVGDPQPDTLPTSVIDENEPVVPVSFSLSQNYPNPFNPSTTILYSLPEESHVTLKVYDILGREVTTLVDDRMSAGHHDAVFDASGLASGMYIYRIKAGEHVVAKRMLLVR